MSEADFTWYGMKPIGKVQILDGRFSITLSDPSAAGLERCIYAYLVGNEILRIGSSKGKLGSRLRAWQADSQMAWLATILALLNGRPKSGVQC